MSILRLFSTSNKQEIIIKTRFLEGYWLHPNEDSITLFTHPKHLEISNSIYCGWDNWDEFIQKIKLEFKDEI